MNAASNTTRPRPLRLQFSLRLLLLAFTAFAIGFPIWYRWPYVETREVRDPTTGAVVEKRITTWQRQFGGDRLLHGKTQRTLGTVTITEHHVAGRMHGPFSIQDAKGRLNTTGQFADDLREGCWTFTQYGEKSIAHYHRGMLHGALEVEASSLTRRAKIVATFDEGRLIEFNGQPVQDRLVDVLKSDALDERTASELRRETQIDVVEMPLADCLLYLSDLHQIPFALDPSLSKPDAPNADMPITDDYCGIDLCSVLTLLTAPRGLACDYRYGSLWITTAADGNDWHDPTGVSEIQPPKGSMLARVWNESAAINCVQMPLSDVAASLEQSLAITIDTAQVPKNADQSILVTLSLRGIPFRHLIGQVLYRTNCRCKLEDETLVILPPDEQ